MAQPSTKKNSSKNAKEEAANSEKTLKERIKSGETAGIYTFSGEEIFLIDYYATQLCKAAGSVIDIDYFRGKLKFGEFTDSFCTVAVHEALDAENTMSMFGEEEPVKSKSHMKIIKLDNPNFAEWDDDEAESFDDLTDSIGAGKILIVFLSEKSASESKAHDKVMKILKKKALNLTFNHLEASDPTLAKWLGKFFAKESIEADVDTLKYMINRVGSDMCTLKNEAEKLCIYLSKQSKKRLSQADVNFICIRNHELTDFAFSNALMDGSFSIAARELKIYEQKHEVPLVVFGLICSAVNNLCRVSHCKRKGLLGEEIASKTGLHPFVVKKHLAALSRRFPGKKEAAFCKYASKRCLDCDKLLKGSAIDNYQLLWFLVFDLCTY